jgi:hypothetical protein
LDRQRALSIHGAILDQTDGQKFPIENRIIGGFAPAVDAGRG